MARFVYEDVCLNEGWHISQPDPIALPRFLEAVGAPADSWWELYEEIKMIQGPKGGRGRESIDYYGVLLRVDRKPVRTRHSSEKERWEVKITVCPPKDGE